MLNFIDISSHQGDIDLSPMPIDAVIVKATESINYVNPWCDVKIEQAKSLGLLWGFYHYAQDNNPVAEAEFFVTNCKNYFGNGIPVLDWEENQSVDWVNAFVSRVYDLTGVWCWIYANPWRFNQGGVEPNCARWVASYPDVYRPDFSYDGECPECDGLVCAWQYASDGDIEGYAGNLDISHYYGDKDSWLRYANKEVPSEPEKKIFECEHFRIEVK